MTRAQNLLALQEATLHRVVSFVNGRRTRRKTCAPGYRKVGSRCRKMSSLEQARIRKGHKRAARKNHIRQGTIQRKRLRSLFRRIASGY
jgi:hypothetical protein